MVEETKEQEANAVTGGQNERLVMRACPDCSGKGGHEHDPNPYWLTDMEFAKPIEWVKCRTCHGKKKLSPLAYACRMARGHAPIAQMRGYA